MDFTISVDASGALGKLRNIDIHKILKEKLHEGGDLILKDAQDKVHVISGDLKASGYVNKREREVEGGFKKDYAKIEEDRVGGQRGGKHAYLGPSVEKNGPIIKKNIEHALKEAFDK